MKKMIKINSKVENLRKIEKFIDDLSTELKLSNEIYGNLMISVLEAVNNAIVHGNKKDENKTVEIKVETGKENIDILIRDQGPGFDYTNIPDPTAPENLEKISGRGIFLMRKLSDKIEFYDKGTLVKLTFYTRN